MEHRLAAAASSGIREDEIGYRRYHALLQERSVTRAAEWMGLSQPAVSAHLGKLRRHFGDDLLIRVGNSYRLTPLAVQLKERVRVAISGVERVFAAEPDFDPASSAREFSRTPRRWSSRRRRPWSTTTCC
ncbi:helix-turn-helix domain-containing protein [Amycolatopsis methanolica]|uniref:helix-turn-helix domain-containing protein n=1 Tax=Amycolatopsis methanolica TaxID=1814 RepID=UPI001CC2288C|nr:LysR family transcriptional regulator [Amycolatopsis methanolica]